VSEILRHGGKFSNSYFKPIEKVNATNPEQGGVAFTFGSIQKSVGFTPIVQTSSKLIG